MDFLRVIPIYLEIKHRKNEQLINNYKLIL